MTEPIPPNSKRSSNDPDDLSLVTFLKTNRPPPPDPDPAAEDRLMQAIARTEQTPPTALKPSWIMVAIAFTSAVLGGLWWYVSQQNSNVFARRELELEAFLVESWQGVSDPEGDIAELDWPEFQRSVSENSPLDSYAYQSHVQESHP